MQLYVPRVSCKPNCSSYSYSRHAYQPTLRASTMTRDAFMNRTLLYKITNSFRKMYLQHNCYNIYIHQVPKFSKMRNAEADAPHSDYQSNPRLTFPTKAALAGCETEVSKCASRTQCIYIYLCIYNINPRVTSRRPHVYIKPRGSLYIYTKIRWQTDVSAFVYGFIEKYTLKPLEKEQKIKTQTQQKYNIRKYNPAFTDSRLS